MDRQVAAACRHLAAAADQCRPRRGLHGLDDVALLHAVRPAARVRLGRAAQLPGGAAHREHRDRLHQPLALRRGLRRPGDARRASAGDPASTSASAARTCCARSILYPLAVSFVVTGTVWSWLSTRPRHQKFVRSLGWTISRFDWITDRDMRDLRHRHHRHLAVVGLRHGAVPRRPALGRSRTSSRRRRSTAPARCASTCASSCRRIAPIFIAVLVVLLQFAIKTFDLVRGADRRRPGHRHHACRRSTSTTSCSSAARSARGAAAAIMMLLALPSVLRALYALRVWRAPPRARAMAERRPLRSRRHAPATLAASTRVASTAARRLRRLLPLPLVVVVAQFVPRPAGDRANGSLIGLPHSFSPGRPRSQAWSSYCIARHLRRHPAQLLQFADDGRSRRRSSRRRSARSTATSLSQWRFRGVGRSSSPACSSACSCPARWRCCPGPRARQARPLQHDLRPRPHPHRPGPHLHHAVLPQLLRRHPRRPDQGGAHRRRRLLAHLLARSSCRSRRRS